MDSKRVIEPAPDVQPAIYPEEAREMGLEEVAYYTHPPAADVQELVAALMIIAGKQRCVDSLMSNVDIAVEALKKWEGK